MKSILMSIRLYYFYCTYKGIKTVEIRKKFPFNYKGKIYEYVSKTNWKQDLMKIPEEEREFFKQFVGKVGLCFECDNVEYIEATYDEYNYGEDDYATETLRPETLYGETCVSREQMFNYLGLKGGYAIHISKLEIFDTPKELNEFYGYTEEKVKRHIIDFPTGKVLTVLAPLFKAPQSRQYIEVEE